MMLWVSNSGEGLCIAYRLQQEGVDVQAYVHHPAFENNYDGLLPKVRLSQLRKAAKKADTVVFDLVRPKGDLKRDTEILRVFDVKQKPTDKVFGPIADKLRAEGKTVIGTSSMTETLELDRTHGSTVAKKLGFKTPVTYDFPTLSAARRFLSNKQSLWVLKPHNNQDLDLTYVENFPGELHHRLRHDIRRRVGQDEFPLMLQKRIEGTALSTEGWFDGQEFTLFNHTLEDKSLLNGGLGPHVGSQSNLVWTKPSRLMDPITRKLQGLAPVLREAGFVGPIDVNTLIADKNQDAYFLEWTPRFGYDAIQCLFSLLPEGKLEEFFRSRFHSPTPDNRKWAASQRISIPPYPYEAGDLLERAKGIEIREDPRRSDIWWQDVRMDKGGLQCAGADGIIGVITCTGFSIGEATKSVQQKAQELRIGSYKQYRTDHAECARGKFNSLPIGGPPVS